MIPDSLFFFSSKYRPRPSQSPFFHFSKSLFLLPPSPFPVLLKVPFLLPPSPFPILSVLFPPLQVLSHPPSPLPSSESSSVLSKSSPILFVLFPPPPSQRKQRNDTKPSRRSRGGVVWLRLYLCLRYWRMCMMTFTVHPFPSILHFCVLEHSHLYQSGIV